MRTKRLNNDIPETPIRVNGGFVRFLTSVRELVTVEMGLYLACEFPAGERFQAHDAVSAFGQPCSYKLVKAN